MTRAPAPPGRRPRRSRASRDRGQRLAGGRARAGLYRAERDAPGRFPALMRGGPTADNLGMNVRPTRFQALALATLLAVAAGSASAATVYPRVGLYGSVLGG